MKDPRIELLKEAVEHPKTFWNHLSTWMKWLVLGVLALLVIYILVRGFEGVTDWRLERQLSDLKQQIELAKQEAAKARAVADEKAREAAEKDQLYQQAKQLAEAAEVERMAASAVRKRSQGTYERIRDSPVDQTKPPPDVDTLCRKLQELGKPCQ